MSEKKSAEEIEFDEYNNIYMDVVKLVEQDNIVAEFYSATVKKLKDKYIIKLREESTLTPEEEQAMDGIAFHLEYSTNQIKLNRSDGIVFIGKGKEIDIIGNLICRLLNAEQKRRKL